MHPFDVTIPIVSSVISTTNITMVYVETHMNTREDKTDKGNATHGVKVTNGSRSQVADGHLGLGRNVQSSNLMISLIINNQHENINNC